MSKLSFEQTMQKQLASIVVEMEKIYTVLSKPEVIVTIHVKGGRTYIDGIDQKMARSVLQAKFDELSGKKDAHLSYVKSLGLEAIKEEPTEEPKEESATLRFDDPNRLAKMSKDINKILE